MVAVTHAFSSAISDDPAAASAGKVLPSHWNANHTISMAATQRVVGRNTSGAGAAEEVTLTQLLDWIGSAAQGDLLYRGASAWARLAAGTNGQFLQTQGAGANPQWATTTGFGDPGGNGVVVRTALNTTTNRTITAGANISVTNGDGVSGNPTIAITGQVPVANGGTGSSSLTSGSVLVGNGTGAVTLVAPSTSGNVLTSNGSTWTSAAAPSVPSAASQSDMESASSNTVYATPGRIKNSPFVPKVWGLITGVGGGGLTLQAGSGISSLSAAGSDSVTINFSTAFSSTNYCVVGIAHNSGTPCDVVPTNKTTGAVTIDTNNSSGPTLEFCIFGDQ